MYPSRGNNEYVQHQQQQHYPGQPAYGRNLGPDGGASQLSMSSRYTAMLNSGPQLSGAHYGGQYTSVYGSMPLGIALRDPPGASTRGTRPPGLEGRRGYGLAMQELPKYVVFGDDSVATQNYGHKTEHSDYPPVDRDRDRHHYIERPNVYIVPDSQNEPIAPFADSVNYGYNQHQARLERFDTVRALRACMVSEGLSVSSHVLMMKGYIDRLDRLGFPLGQELAVDLVLNSLPKSYDHFVMNYNMNGLDKTLSELYEMIKTAEMSIDSKLEQSMSKKSMSKKVLMIKAKSGIAKKKANVAKGKTKVGSSNKDKGKGKIPEEDAVCFNCNEKGHWKRNCPVLLATNKKQKANGAGASGSKKCKAIGAEATEAMTGLR